MATFLDNHLKAVGVETKLADLGSHSMEGQQLKLPPAILGKIGTDPTKKTVLIYGHYDVQPVCLHLQSITWSPDRFCSTCPGTTDPSARNFNMAHLANLLT